jgi:hypothetical protein
MLAIRLVRAIADSLQTVSDLEALVSQYQRASSDDVIPIAEALETPQVMLLDYQRALAAAYYLRAQEIQAEGAQADIQRRLAAARAQGQRWAVITSFEQRRYRQTFFRQLEMRLSDGLSVLFGNDLDIERGLTYALEPMWLDPNTGKPQRGVALPEPRQEYPTREALLEAVTAFRQKYA